MKKSSLVLTLGVSLVLKRLWKYSIGGVGPVPYPCSRTAELAKRFAKLQGRGYAAAMVNGTITMEVDEALFRAGQIGMDDGVAAIKKIQANAKERNAAADELRKKYAR